MSRDIAPVNSRPWLTISVSTALLLNGCFFDQVQRSEESDIKRVEQKHAILQTEQDRSAMLQQQEEQLIADLSDRQFALNDLNNRVQEINVDNGRAIADNDAARVQYHDLLAQLHDTHEQLGLAQQGTVDSLEERRERIAALRARLRTQLDQLLR